MAVHADRRRGGVGGRLLEHAAASAGAGVRFLVVTTLSAATPEPDVEDSYAGTRAFWAGRATSRCGSRRVGGTSETRRC